MAPLAVLILHGWNGSGPGHWQRWLAQRLAASGAQVRFPELPDRGRPCPVRWATQLHDELAALAGTGRERVVVCHSLACVLWVREAARVRPEHRPERVVLVAPPCPDAGIAALEGFFGAHADRDAMAAAAGTTLLVCADDDPYCPAAGAAQRWGVPLGLPVDVVGGGGHLNVESGYGPWPAMEDWCLGRTERIVTYAGAKNGAET